ncbi:hypothetical protein [Rhodococcus sp. O3]|uniref:hypothetical protein n=1 Tax=Rhodococcus sp. O3 TaxID=3404919 RepID=UPI003B6803FB
MLDSLPVEEASVARGGVAGSDAGVVVVAGTVGSHVGGTGSVVVVVDGTVGVVVGAVVVGTAHGSIVVVSVGACSGTLSGAAGCVVVGVVGAAGVVSVGCAIAADPPTATMTATVLVTRHRRHHLCRDMTEPPLVCESIYSYCLSIRLKKRWRHRFLAT